MNSRNDLGLAGALCVMLFVAGVTGFYVGPKWGFGFLAVCCGYCIAAGLIDYIRGKPLP